MGLIRNKLDLGSQIAAIDTIHTGGSTQFTGNTLDLAIAGDGFFQVVKKMQDQRTIDNVFNIQEQEIFIWTISGVLVNSDGLYGC